MVNFDYPRRFWGESCGAEFSFVRHCLRVMPAEATMYASVEEVQRAAKSVILQHFPAGSEQSPIKVIGGHEDIVVVGTV